MSSHLAPRSQPSRCSIACIEVPKKIGIDQPAVRISNQFKIEPRYHLFLSLGISPKRMIPDFLARRSTVSCAETNKKAQRPVRGEDLPCIALLWGKEVVVFEGETRITGKGIAC